MDTAGQQGSEVYAVRLDGDIDIERRSDITALIDGFRSSRSRDVELDVTAVSFIDSTGLSGLLTLAGVAQHRGGELRVLGPQRQFRRVLDISGVGSLCTVIPPLGEGLDEPPR